MKSPAVESSGIHLLVSKTRPTLFATAARFEQLRDRFRSDPVYSAVFELLREDADAAINAAPIEYVERGAFLLDPIRLAMGRILSTAMCFRLTGERRYLDCARKELLILATLPDWCPRHFLDVGEACLTCAVGLDWLHDSLSADDRKTVTDAIIHKALRESLHVPDTAYWVKSQFNWNCVCHAGLISGALAVVDQEPELTKTIIDRAVMNLPHAANSYAPDGSYPEGPSYWSYGTTFYVLAIELLRHGAGHSFGLENNPGFLASVDWMTQMAGPTGEDFNFADYHTRHSPEPVKMWFARELGRQDLLQKELRDLAALKQSRAARADFRPDAHSRLLPLELIWADSTLLTDGNTVTLPLNFVAGGALPSAAFRSSWTDPRATYVAIKGGTPNSSHAHMDVGSFIMESDGVRWAIDLGTENYVKMRSAKIQLWTYLQDSTHWSVFRNGPDGHNILRFNDARQVYNGQADIHALPADESAHGAVANLDALYAGQAKDVRRAVRLHADRSVTIDDRWTASATGVDVQWQWLTRAQVTITPSGATLKEQGATLNLTVTSTASWTLWVDDVSQPRGAADSENPGVRRIGIQVHTPPGASGGLLVRAMPITSK